MRTRLNHLRPALAALGFLGGLGCVAALADGYPPYFGFSGYYGGPVPYYTHDTDVQQTTRLENGWPTFGVRTYTAGGPFWRYKTHHPGTLQRSRRARYVRVKG